MKKMILLGLSVFGMTNLASAWERTFPQQWSTDKTVKCLNQQGGICMGGPGKSPERGDLCIIYDMYGGGWRFGTVLSVVADPGSNDAGGPLFEGPTVIEVSSAEVE